MKNDDDKTLELKGVEEKLQNMMPVAYKLFLGR